MFYRRLRRAESIILRRHMAANRRNGREESLRGRLVGTWRSCRFYGEPACFLRDRSSSAGSSDLCSRQKSDGATCRNRAGRSGAARFFFRRCRCPRSFLISSLGISIHRLSTSGWRSRLTPEPVSCETREDCFHRRKAFAVAIDHVDISAYMAEAGQTVSCPSRQIASQMILVHRLARFVNLSAESTAGKDFTAALQVIYSLEFNRDEHQGIGGLPVSVLPERLPECSAHNRGIDAVPLPEIAPAIPSKSVRRKQSPGHPTR